DAGGRSAGVDEPILHADHVGGGTSWFPEREEMASKFELVSPWPPAGDQPQAIEKLVTGFAEGKKGQVLMGATGTGKTFSAAATIARLGRPTLVLSHNKTLAAQLYKEFKGFFPRNAVHYFVS